MSGEYNIDLSNGSVLTTIYPLEVNGPDNLSTPRLIANIVGSPPSAFVLNGDLTYRFVAGFTFEVQDSGFGSPSNDGTYTVSTGGSTYDSVNNQTIIPVDEAIVTSGLPYGQIQYSVPLTLGSPQELNTTLRLPGRGSINYGELIMEDLVHLTENFAADVSPDNNANLGDSPYGYVLTGQLWYDTSSDVLKHWNGSAWIALFSEGFTPYLGDLNDVNDANHTGSPAGTVTITDNAYLFKGNGSGDGYEVQDGTLGVLNNVATGADTPNDGDVLVYNSSASEWQPVQGDKPKYVQYTNVTGGSTGPYATPGIGGSNVNGGTASLQVFLNGVYQIEGLSYTYSTGGSPLTGQITFNSAIPDPSDIIIYEF